MSSKKKQAGSRLKFSYQDITKTNGQLLTIRHDIKEDGQRKRLRFVRCDFNTTGDSFVAVDHRGSVFLFSVARQFYCVLPGQIPRCSCIKFHPCPKRKDLLLATKDGTLLLMEYNVENIHTEDASGWSSPTTSEGTIEPELSFGTAAAAGRETTATVEATIKLRTHPYPRGNSIINLSFPTSATAAAARTSSSTANNPIISPKATSTRLSAPPLAACSSSASNTFLSMTKTQCTVHDLDDLHELFHVDTADCLTLKQAIYLPPFDYVLLGICGDDTLRVWGLPPSAEARDDDLESKFRRHFDIVAMRDQFLHRKRAQNVTMTLKRSSSSENVVECLKKDFSSGNLTAFACSRDARWAIVATLDSTLVLLATNDGEFSVERVLRLANEVYVTKIDFLSSEPPTPEGGRILCRTNIGDLLLLAVPSAADPSTPQPPPFLVVEGNCVDFACAPNTKLFAVHRDMGEIDWYSLDFILRKMETELEKRSALLRTEKRSTGGGAAAAACKRIPANDVENIQRELQSLLPTKRLIAILNEYDEYPQRQIVWRSLLKLPHNEAAFCELLRKGYHPCVKAYDNDFPLKSRAALRNLKKIVSCLAFWSPAFAATAFVPHFVFPFLKVHEKNLLFTFEVCASIFLNHGQLLFEFAPLEPFNYLGMIENLVAHYDPKLMEFYMRKKITSTTFAWPIVSTAFAEVLDTAQWLQLWDHLITNSPDFMVFVAVAYNMVQRPIIMRLEKREEIESFFRDQNLIDMKRLLRNAYSLATQCPAVLKPQQYIRPFEPLLAPVYQKFYNYPREAVDKSLVERQRMLVERDALEAKMNAVAGEENRMLAQLERQLADEEHAKRLAKVERALDELRVQEAMETANKHHLAVLCEREQRNKELAVAADLNECLTRKRVQAKEQELDAMLRELDKDRIGEQMELQLCEERRQMMDVESQVKKRLVAFASQKTLQPQPGCGGGGDKKTMLAAAAARTSETAAEAAFNTSRMKRDQQPDNKSKLIKYSDRFRRNQ